MMEIGAIQQNTADTMRKTTDEDRARRRKLLKNRYKKHAFLYLLMLPILAGYVIFCYVPLVNGTVMSFQKFSVGKSIFQMSFNKFANYKQIFADPVIVLAVRNTLFISALKLVFGFFPPIILAILLFDIHNRLYKRICQTLLYIPYFFSWIIVYGIFFAFFATGSGFVNMLAEALGGKAVPYLTTNSGFLFLIVLASVWKNMGWGSILYLAGLTSISPELFEAAKIDGCGPFRRIFSITLPLLMPIVSFCLIMSIGSILGSDLEQILMFYTESVSDVAEVLSTWIVNRGLSSLKNYGVGIAVGILNGVVSLILMIVANFTSQKISGRGMW